MKFVYSLSLTTVLPAPRVCKKNSPARSVSYFILSEEYNYYGISGYYVEDK